MDVSTPVTPGHPVDGTEAPPTLTRRVIDLTHPLKPGMPVFPGDDHFSYTPKATIDESGYNVRTMTIGSHTGTHMDAPFHFFSDGRKIDEIPLEGLVGQRVVVIDLVAHWKRKGDELKARDIIRWDDVKGLLGSPGVIPGPSTGADNVRRVHWEPRSRSVVVLLYTGWSDRFWGKEEYFHHPFLHSDIAEQLLKANVRIVGTDTLNPDETEIDGVGGQYGYKFHETFLGAGGVIIENVAHLGKLVECGVDEKWEISVVPLNIEGSDGSPVRLFVTST